MYKNLLIEKKGKIATLTINRPEKLNAVNFEVLKEIENALYDCRKDPTIGVIILTGAGEKSFVAGSDISLLSTLNPRTGFNYAKLGHRVLNKIQNSPKPVIAGINGYALGSGCEMILACHIRIATSNARFGFPEVGLGLIPGHGGTQRLARIVGMGNATEMILTGKTLSAEDALKIGLVNMLVPPDELRKTLEEISNTILSKSLSAIKIALRAINFNFDHPLKVGLRKEIELFKECLTQNDFREGTKAFMEKRKPEFKGQ